jgi:hypothetical protein
MAGRPGGPTRLAASGPESLDPRRGGVLHMEGTYVTPNRGDDPAYRGGPTVIQLPPLSPSALVREQAQLPPSRAAAGCSIQRSGGGTNPTGTPANGGFRGAATSRNLSIRHGQRPSIHRLHRSRGREPPSFGHRSGATTGPSREARRSAGALLRREGSTSGGRRPEAARPAPEKRPTW